MLVLADYMELGTPFDSFNILATVFVQEYIDDIKNDRQTQKQTLLDLQRICNRGYRVENDGKKILQRYA